ncbi:unnamed protein product [Peniophora sp. CBMAI 1063]|nr:unnamed protein product [Peniophora sp. CBMAI 1063]
MSDSESEADFGLRMPEAQILEGSGASVPSDDEVCDLDRLYPRSYYHVDANGKRTVVTLPDPHLLPCAMEALSRVFAAPVSPNLATIRTALATLDAIDRASTTWTSLDDFVRQEMVPGGLLRAYSRLRDMKKYQQDVVRLTMQTAVEIPRIPGRTKWVVGHPQRPDEPVNYYPPFIHDEHGQELPYDCLYVQPTSAGDRIARVWRPLAGGGWMEAKHGHPHPDYNGYRLNLHVEGLKPCWVPEAMLPLALHDQPYYI